MDINRQQNDPSTWKQGEERWYQAFGQYNEYDENGKPQADYDKDKGQRFYSCQTDPLSLL